MRISATLLLFILVQAVLGLASANQNVQATTITQSAHSAPVSYSPTQKTIYNATQQKVVTAWGVWGSITWTNPPLNGGTFSAHRVVLNQQSPWRYTEIGWSKFPDGLYLAVAWNDGAAPGTQYFPGLSPTTHLYSSQYDPNTGKHWFYLDDSPAFFSRSMNFTSGDRVIGGGEVYDGVESMGRTRLFDLRYSVNNGGNFYYTSWNGYTRYVEDSVLQYTQRCKFVL